MTNSTTGKHYFVIHSPLTVMLCKMIMARRGLDPQSVYVAVNNSIEDLAKKVLGIPVENIFNDQSYARQESDLVGQFKIENFVQFGQSYVKAIAKLMDLNIELPAIDPSLTLESPALIPAPEQIAEADKFTIYLPHLLNVRTNISANLPWCKEVCLLEDGSMNYANLDHKRDPNLAERYSESIADKPYYDGKFTGIYEFDYERGFKVDSLKGPQHQDNHSPKIYVLSDLAYHYIDYGYPLNKDILNYHQLLELDKLKTLLHHFPWQELRERVINYPLIKNNQLIQSMLADPLNINQRINLIIFEGKNGEVSDKDYLNAMHKLIKEIKAKGVFFAFVKHHPLLQEELRSKVEALLSQEQMLVEFIPDYVALELEFILAEDNSMIIHSAASSVMLYAALFNQIVIPYSYLVADIKYYRKLFSKHEFDISKLVSQIYELNNIPT